MSKLYQPKFPMEMPAKGSRVYFAPACNLTQVVYVGEVVKRRSDRCLVRLLNSTSSLTFELATGRARPFKDELQLILWTPQAEIGECAHYNELIWTALEHLDKCSI